MKTVNYFLIICLCLCLSACNSNDKPEVEEPEVEEPVEVEEPEVEDPVEVEEPEVEEPVEVEEPEIDEPCPDLDEVNPHFVYGDIPSLAERLAYMGMERPADSYNFPLYIVMDEWKTLTLAEKSAARQVTPACLLKKMSTQAVIQAIWEMPTLEEYTDMEPVFQTRIERTRRSHNAIDELCYREDAGTALLERLTLVDPLTPILRSESQILELLLTRTEFLLQLNEGEKRKTVEVTLAHDYKRYGEWFAGGYAIPLRPIAWILMGKAMYTACYCPLIKAMNENEELKYFIEGWKPYFLDPSKISDYYYSEVFYGNIPQIITNFAKNFINE